MAFSNANMTVGYSRINASSGNLKLFDGDWFAVSLNGSNSALSINGEQASQKFNVEITQALSGGPYSPTFWPGITWLTSDGSAPTMPTTAGAVLVVGVKCIGGSIYYAWVENGAAGGGGTMATQNANAVAITGGTIDGATIGATTPVQARAHRPANAQTGTSYTFVLGDADKFVTLSNASAVAVTLPLHASVALPVLAEIDVFNIGAGATTITPTSGATINGSGSGITINQWQGGSLKQLTTDGWIYLGSHA